MGIDFEKNAKGEGVRITLAAEDSAAKKCGLGVGNIILSVDGKKVTKENMVSLVQGSGKKSIQIVYLRYDSATEKYVKWLVDVDLKVTYE